MGKGRAPCCDKSKVRSGPWSPAEDFRLITFIQKHGHPNWRALPKQAGLLRCGKSCRLRWINYLRPDVKRGSFSPQEEETIISLHSSIGNKWSKIAASLPGRTDNEIKNVWNTYLKKRAMKHCPNTESNSSTVDVPASSSSTASSSRSSRDDESTEKLPRQDDDRVPPVHGNQTMVSDEYSDSPSYRDGSNNVWDHNWSIQKQDDMYRPEEELGNEAPIKHRFDDDIDFWEFIDSMDINQLEEEGIWSNDDTRNDSSPAGNYSGTSDQDDFGQWLRNLEHELGLKSDVDGRLPESCGDSDSQSTSYYCPEMWPSSPLYFGI